MRIFAGLYDSPTGALLYNLSRARGVRFSTNERGFASFQCTARLSLPDAFFIYDRPTLPHIAVMWGGGVIWEGRLEDVAIVPEGLRLTALGYIRGYADAPYSASHIAVTAQTIVQALVASASGVNSFMSSSTMLVQSPGVTLTEVYEDLYPIDILNRLCNLGDNQTTPRLWEAGVFENRMLHFRPRGDVARKWAIDVADPDIERTLELLYNSAYAAYQDGGNQRAVTATSSNAASIARYGLTRRAAINLQSVDATLAGKVRDAFLEDRRAPPVRSSIGFRRLFDANGVQWPPWVVRSGDQVTARNLPPALSTDVDRIRTFRLKETDFDADANIMRVIPEALFQSIAPENNAIRAASVSDPNLQYQPRPTLAELYADFQGLPGLRGLWYPGSTDNAGALYDQSGQGRTLTYTGNPTLNVYNSFIPFYDLDGTGDYFTRADEAGLDIIGNETTIASALRGLTIGLIMRPDTYLPDNYYFGKWTETGNQRSYLIYCGSTGAISMNVSVDGTAVKASASAQLTTGAYNFVVGRFTPSTEVKIFVNELTGVNTSAVPATIFNSTSAFVLGAKSGGGGAVDAAVALAFVCAAILPDAQINHLFARVRKFFGM